jgi:hypothetical protein
MRNGMKSDLLLSRSVLCTSETHNSNAKMLSAFGVVCTLHPSPRTLARHFAILRTRQNYVRDMFRLGNEYEAALRAELT